MNFCVCLRTIRLSKLDIRLGERNEITESCDDYFGKTWLFPSNHRKNLTLVGLPYRCWSLGKTGHSHFSLTQPYRLLSIGFSGKSATQCTAPLIIERCESLVLWRFCFWKRDKLLPSKIAPLQNLIDQGSKLRLFLKVYPRLLLLQAVSCLDYTKFEELVNGTNDTELEHFHLSQALVLFHSSKT